MRSRSELFFARFVLILWSTHSCLAYTGFYADNGIDQTVIYHTASKRDRREMQEQILSLLGLHHRPRPSSHAIDSSAPKYMIDLYKSFVDEENGNLKFDGITLQEIDHISNNSVRAINDADIIMSFVNHGHHLNHIRHDKDRRFWFDVSEVPAEETIMSAELRLYKQPINSENCASYNITVYEVAQGVDPEDKELHYLDSANITVDEEGWIKLNVTRASSDWVVFPGKNLGLFIEIHTEGRYREVHPKDIGIIGPKGEASKQPFMVAFFKTPQELHLRRTRAAKRNQRTEVSFNDPNYNWNYTGFNARFARRSCQKRTLYVSFRELGWQDWIIAPDGYAAYYCHGECAFPLNAHMNATNHAIVQTLVHLMHPAKVPKPCCAPTKLTAISVLYYDDNANVILQKYRNMVVKTCGCH